MKLYLLWYIGHQSIQQQTQRISRTSREAQNKIESNNDQFLNCKYLYYQININFTTWNEINN